MADSCGCNLVYHPHQYLHIANVTVLWHLAKRGAAPLRNELAEQGSGVQEWPRHRSVGGCTHLLRSRHTLRSRAVKSCTSWCVMEHLRA